MRRDSFAPISEHPPPGLGLLGQPFAIAGPAMLLKLSGACLLRALEVMIWLRGLIESIWEETRSNR